MLTGTLQWRKGVSAVVVGLSLMLLGFAIYEASRQVPAIPDPARLLAFLAFLSAVLGYSGRRVVKSIEFKPWLPKP
jgi:hypothetical protein